MAVVITPIGGAYIAATLSWTLLVIAGSAFLYYHRHLPCLQIRRLPVMFTGIFFLHMYAGATFTGYVYGALLPCSVEFWIMSTWLPLGIAIFHASNSQFLYVATRQKRFARMGDLTDAKPIGQIDKGQRSNNRFRSILGRIVKGDPLDQMITYVAIGLLIELALTLFVFFGSEKFHPGYGIFNYTVKGTGAVARMNCSKGWEWWLSIVWQMFWSWAYAPYLLWKSRGIQDAHGWRIQTICCCLASLHGSPLWLAGLYSPAFAPVNKYWIPPAWIGSSILLLEVFAIGFPIIQVFKTNSLRQETLDAIANWEKRQQEIQTYGGGSTTAESDASSKKTAFVSIKTTDTNETKVPTKRGSIDSMKSELFNMTALEHALRTNAEPLLHFAALKDFSGENISFLTHLAEWKRKWFVATASTEDQRHQQFISAVRLYASFVSLEFSEFPINISSREMKFLHNIFEGAAAIMFRRGSVSSDSATPFDMESPADSASTSDLKTGINLESLGRANLKAVQEMSGFGKAEALADVQPPETFTPDVFESAEQEIKYLVLTNTWPKFVTASWESSQANIEEVKPSWWAGRTLCSV